MTSTNLTHTEAQARAQLISDVHYRIDLDLSHAAHLADDTFPTTTTVTFTSGAGDTFIDLRAPEVTRVLLDGEDIRAAAVGSAETGPGSYDATKGLQLPGLTAGRHELRVEARGQYSTTGEGLHRFQDPADSEVYLYTQFETGDAKRVFACFDQPDIKATYDVSVTTPAAWTVVTNNFVSSNSWAAASGNAASAGSDAEIDGGTVVHTSSVDYLLSTYLIAFCVGPWYAVHDSWTGTITQHPECAPERTAAAAERGQIITSGELTVPLGIYCRQSLAPFLDAEELFTITKQGFGWYAENFGVAYPFYKYDQIFCPEYNMGAMENAGCVTLRDEYIFRSAASHYQYERRADTILHELAHMWFGDLVTMRWWDDLWLNESFATWSSAMCQAGATKYTTAWVTFANKEKAWAYGQDQMTSTHPIFTDASDLVTVDANFDGITYAKGASVLKQLAAYVGLDAFLAGIRAHFAAHAWGNATFDDLLAALQDSSGKDLSGWADAWLKTTGINTLRAEYEVDNGTYTSFRVVQEGAQPGAGEVRPHLLQVGVFDVDGSTSGVGDEGAEATPRVIRRHSATVEIDSDSVDVPELVGTAAGDVVLVNDGDLTYALTPLDEQSLRTVTQAIAGIDDPMARSLIWSTAWQMTRNAQMRARDFVALVARGAVAETELAVLEQNLALARSAVENYSDPAWSPTGWEQLREAFLRGANERTGSAQLAFARAYVQCVQSAESVQVLKGLLDGSGAIPGLDVDQDLRWMIIIALAGASRTLGEDASDTERRVTAELGRDSSSAGHANAVQARSAVASPEVKRAVFTSIVEEGPKLSNLMLRHKIAGLVHPGHEDLLQPFGPEYVTCAVPLWESLTKEMALRTLEGIYPHWDFTEATDAAIARLMEDPSTPAGLRRTLSEGRHRVARAKANRAADARED